MARRKDKAEGQSPSALPPASGVGPTPNPQAPAPKPSAESPAAGVPNAQSTPTPSAPQLRLSHARVLCVERSARAPKALRHAVEALGLRFESVSTIAAARVALASDQFDAAVVDDLLTDGSALDLVRELTANPNFVCRFIVTSSNEAISGAVDAMRSGATDFVQRPFTAESISPRIAAALEHAKRLRDSARKMDRLQRICKRLNSAREEASDHVDTLCNDLVTAYQDMEDQMSTATLSSEFNALVRQELDVESLLRTTLEFMLTRTGPTNAAVFLPTGHHDYNLGAYVNYDIPRDTADVLLDHLADVIPPRYEELTDILRLETEGALRAHLGEEANWLAESGVVIFSCMDEDECLAIVALFRDRRTPFTDELVAQVEVMRDVFTQQLARVVRIHHRAIASPDWPGFDIEDDRGMAA